MSAARAWGTLHTDSCELAACPPCAAGCAQRSACALSHSLPAPQHSTPHSLLAPQHSASDGEHAGMLLQPSQVGLWPVQTLLNSCFLCKHALLASHVSGLHFAGASFKVASDGSGWSQREGKQQQGEAAGRGQQNKQRWTRAAGLQLSAAEAGTEAPGACRLLGVACGMKGQRESTSATLLRQSRCAVGVAAALPRPRIGRNLDAATQPRNATPCSSTGMDGVNNEPQQQHRTTYMATLTQHQDDRVASKEHLAVGDQCGERSSRRVRVLARGRHSSSNCSPSAGTRCDNPAAPVARCRWRQQHKLLLLLLLLRRCRCRSRRHPIGRQAAHLMKRSLFTGLLALAPLPVLGICGRRHYKGQRQG